MLVPLEFTLFTELAPSKSRAFLTNVMNIYWSIGYIYIVLICWGFQSNWRISMALASIPAWISFAMHLFIYESPRYLLIHGRTKEANAVVSGMAQWNKSPVTNIHLIDKSTHLEDIQNTNFFSQITLLFSKELAVSTVLLWIIWLGTSYGSWGFSYAFFFHSYC